jgi:hypothetical protein
MQRVRILISVELLEIIRKPTFSALGAYRGCEDDLFTSSATSSLHPICGLTIVTAGDLAYIGLVKVRVAEAHWLADLGQAQY